MPASTIARSGSSISSSRSIRPCAVLSPPGSTNRSNPLPRSDACLSSTHRAPSLDSMRSCSANAPCTARIPTRPDGISGHALP